jgi:hypothetical protein
MPLGTLPSFRFVFLEIVFLGEWPVSNGRPPSNICPVSTTSLEKKTQKCPRCFARAFAQAGAVPLSRGFVSFINASEAYAPKIDRKGLSAFPV